MDPMLVISADAVTGVKVESGSIYVQPVHLFCTVEVEESRIGAQFQKFRTVMHVQ